MSLRGLANSRPELASELLPWGQKGLSQVGNIMGPIKGGSLKMESIWSFFFLLGEF
jgi:hypothetical protein